MLRLVGVLARKDFRLFLRDRFFLATSLLSLILYVSVYYLLPAATTERFNIAVYPRGVPAGITELLERRSMELTAFDTEAALVQAVEAGEYRAGFLLTPDVVAALMAGERVRVPAYYPPGIPENLDSAFTDFMTLAFNDIAYTLSSEPLHIERHEEVLGMDLRGTPIAPRDRLLPLFAVLLLMMETLGLASLLTQEVERGTARAVLVTPVRLRELFLGKSIAGLGIAFVQVGILLALTGSLGSGTPLLLLALLGGALLVTGVGFIIAAVAKDMLSVIGWGMLAILLLGLPAATVMFPGTISGWVQAIPSYYLIDTLHRVLNFGAVWADVSRSMGYLFGSSLAVLALGAYTLGRKLR